MELQMSNENVYIADDIDATIAQICGRKWLDESLHDDRMTKLLKVGKFAVGFTTRPRTLFGYSATEPFIASVSMQDINKNLSVKQGDGCLFCDKGICSSTLETNVWHDGMWDNDKYLYADYVMIKTSSLCSDKLEFETCEITAIREKIKPSIGKPTFRGHEFMAISHVSSECWFNCGISREMRGCLYAIAKDLGMDYVWIDTLCLPPGDRTRQLQTMGLLYKSAKCVCIVSQEVLESGYPYKLFTSTWMTRVWTLQEGYNAKELAIITNLHEHKYAIMKHEDIPKSYRHLFLQEEHMSASSAIAIFHGRHMSNYNDAIYAVASLVSRRHRGLTNYTSYLAGTIVSAISLCISLPSAVTGYVINLRWLYYASLVILAIGTVGFFSVPMMYIRSSWKNRKLEWTNPHDIFKLAHGVESSMLLMSPEPDLPKELCWYPGLMRQHSIEVAVVLSMKGESSQLYENPLRDLNDIGKYGMKTRGILLDKEQTLEFIQYINQMQDWLWMEDAKTKAEKYTDTGNVFICCQGYDIMWMSFGFVIPESDNILYREDRFWILPITCAMATRCLTKSKMYWIGSKNM